MSPFVLEQVARVPEFDPVLTINFKMNRIVAKKPAGMTTQAAVAALLGTLTNYADKVLEFPDPHQVSHQLVAFFEDSSRIYEVYLLHKACS